MDVDKVFSQPNRCLRFTQTAGFDSLVLRSVHQYFSQRLSPLTLEDV